jgi:hypothetical protein
LKNQDVIEPKTERAQGYGRKMWDAEEYFTKFLDWAI